MRAQAGAGPGSEGPGGGPEGAEGGAAGAAERVAGALAKVAANPATYLVGGGLAVFLVSGEAEQLGPIVLLSAAPVVGLTLISKSGAGEAVAEALQRQKPGLVAEAEAAREAREAARAASPLFGPARPLWLGPLGGAAAHLEGAAAGDYGFDPLGLGAEPEAFKRNLEAELLHARWAMLAAVGCLVPELLARAGVDVGEPVWWRVGATKLQDGITLNYAGIEGFRIAGKQGVGAIAVCQLALMGGPEYARQVGIESLEPVGIFLPGDKNFPGSSLFDPLGLSADGPGFIEQSVKEIKNGRIAMLAMLGYATQAAVTGKGPVDNLLDFLSDPAHNNVLAYLGQ